MKNKALTETLVEEFIDRSSKHDTLSEAATDFDRDLREEADRGEFRTDELDWDHAFDLFEKEDDRLKLWRTYKDNTGYRLDEATSAFVDSKFAHFLQTNYRIGVMETCDTADRTLLSCVGRRDINCDRNVDTDLPKNDLLPVLKKKGESTDKYQLGDMNYREWGGAQKYKMGFEIYREDRCNAMLDVYVRIIRDGRTRFENLQEIMLTKLMGNIAALDADGVPQLGATYAYNGVSYNFYQPLGGSGPWGNYHQGTPGDGTFPSPTKCNIDFLSFLDTLQENKEGIVKQCLPVDCRMVNMQALTISEKAQRRLQALQQPSQVRYKVATEDCGNAERTVNMPGESRISEVKYSKYLREAKVKDWMTKHGITRADAEKLAESFWMVGDFQRAFVMGVEWDYEHMERGSLTNMNDSSTFENYDRECIFGTKDMMKFNVEGGDPCAFYTFDPVPA